MLNSSQSDNGKTSRVAIPAFHSTSATSSAQAHPVSKQQSHAPVAPPSSGASCSNYATQSSATSRACGVTSKSLSHAQATPASIGAPHGSRAQSFLGFSHVDQPFQAPHHDQPSSQFHGNIRLGNTKNITNTNDNTGNDDADNDADNDDATDSDADDNSNISDTSNPGDNTNVHWHIWHCSNLKNTVPLPTQLCFYTGPWVDVLKEAKYQYRLFIHTEIPFLEHNRNTLSDAHICLVEAAAKYEEEVQIGLDGGLLHLFLIGID